MRNALRQACRHGILVILGFLILAGGSATLAAEAEKADESAGKKYTATAYLLVERHDPHILPRAADKDDPAEFESFRATQMQLFKSPYVLMAALRYPKVKTQPSVLREDARHNVIAWLGKEIRVKCPNEKTGLLTVSLTSNDREEAAALVNAVVEAYMDEVVNYDRQRRRDRLSDLQQISAEKENEVRTKREQLKRELENIGAGDDETMKARSALALNIYAEFLREFQRMKAEHRALLGRLAIAKKKLVELPALEIPLIEINAILNKNPAYHDLQNRLALLEANRRNIEASSALPDLAPLLPDDGLSAPNSNPPKSGAAVPRPAKPNRQLARTIAELKATNAQLEALETQACDWIRGAHRIKLENEVRRLKCQIEISAEQLAAFEKEVERKANDADNTGKTSIAAQMAKADVDNVEQVLHAVATEREWLRIDLKSRPRVRVLGDSNSPAAVPECPD